MTDSGSEIKSALDPGRPEIRALLDMALSEDIGPGDITTQAILGAAPALACARIIAKQELVVCGQQLAEAVFLRLDPAAKVRAICADGAKASSGDTVTEIEANLSAILSGERTALNFLQRLSGIATKTASVAACIQASGASILDTRKTTPGWRLLEKYAVKIGGGKNHRIGLFDAFLIKNNHIDALGGNIVEAIRRCREFKTSALNRPLLEVEVRNQAELAAAVAEKPDAILLDNMSPEELKKAAAFVRKSPGGEKIYLEASGGITAETAAAFAAAGINGLSMGALTHSAKAVDLALRIDKMK